EAAGDGFGRGVRRGEVALSKGAGNWSKARFATNTGHFATTQATRWTRDERSEPSTNRQIVQHPVPGQKRGASVQQLVQELDVGDAGMPSGHVHDLDRLTANLLHQLRQHRRAWPQALVDNDALDSVRNLLSAHGWHNSCWLRHIRLRREDAVKQLEACNFGQLSAASLAVRGSERWRCG